MKVLKGQPYHQIQFHQREEAAAFVAALSRFLHYPAGEAWAVPEHSLEVWSSKDAIKLYLSADAFAAADAAFGIGDLAELVGEDIPHNATLVLEGRSTPPMGLQEAQTRMTRT